MNFIDPVSGAYTQNIESYWNRVKLNLKGMRGTNRNMLPGYLDEFMWRKRYGGNTAADCCDAILREIAIQYHYRLHRSLLKNRGATKSCKRNDQYERIVVSGKLLRVKFYNKPLFWEHKFCFFMISAPRDLIIYVVHDVKNTPLPPKKPS